MTEPAPERAGNKIHGFGRYAADLALACWVFPVTARWRCCSAPRRRHHVVMPNVDPDWSTSITAAKAIRPSVAVHADQL